jgi:hypothetical protein
MSDGSLTLAEAIALDPGEVECRFDHQWWLLGDPRVAASLTLRDLRIAKFRRAKPRPSRVQEMAATYGIDGEWRRSYERGAAEAIRAACEWLRAESRLGFERNPDAIEREFLESR